MLIAEKYYLATFKKEHKDLKSEDWKIINMMHRCLQEHNEAKLPHGMCLVNRIELREHLVLMQRAVNHLDKVYNDKSMSHYDRGTHVAKVCNALSGAEYLMSRYEIKVPLKRLNEPF